MRSKGLPALAHIDHAWLANVRSTHGQPARQQWLAAAEAIHVAMLVSWMCGYFLSPKKCDLRPTKVQRYLGILCDSDTATFRVPEDKMDTLQNLLRAALAAGELSFSHVRAHCGDVHEHDGSRPSGVFVDTCHVHSALEAREVGSASDRLVERRVCGPPRGLPPVGRHLVYIAPGPVREGPPLHRRPHRRRDRRILHRVGGSDPTRRRNRFTRGASSRKNG